MTNSEIRSSVKSKIKESYSKLLGYNTIISLIALIVYLPFTFRMPNQPNSILQSIIAFADILALILILAPLDYICKKSSLKISNGESAEQSNPFKLKMEKGMYSKIISLNMRKSIPALLLIIHTLLAIFWFMAPISTPYYTIIMLISAIILITWPVTLIVTTRKLLSYSVADYVFIEQNGISPCDAIKKSKELMKNNIMMILLIYYK